ncbi:MAG TPA: hypothetical protein DCP96_01375 [Lachnospiraceae bacterium]|jgi:hypothetical protein|nr:hypothetical protein [Lachnospiraceae bacterium]
MVPEEYEMKEKIKGFFADMGKAIIILALILVVTVGIIMDFAGKSGSVSSTAAKEDKSRNISVTFEEPIVTKTEELAKMEVLSKELDIPAEIKEDGLFKLPIFRKIQKATYKATVIYTIDLSGISKDDFEVDHAEKTVTLRVPKPQSRVILNYDKFDFQDTKGYFFKTSDIRLTLKQVQQVENDAAKKVEKRIKEDDITREAEEEGLSQLQSIFEDVIGMNTNGYSFEVTY